MVTLWQSSSKKGSTSADMRKTIVIGILGHAQWILLIDCLPQGVTVNGNTYCDVVTCPCHRIQQQRKGKWAKKVFLLHDSALPHSSKQTRAHLVDLGYTVPPHPPYSPDLAPSDYTLFDKMKEPLRGKTFTNADALQGAVHHWCRTMPKDWFQEAILKLPQWRHWCIVLQGDYVSRSWNYHIFTMHCILMKLVSVIFEWSKNCIYTVEDVLCFPAL